MTSGVTPLRLISSAAVTAVTSPVRTSAVRLPMAAPPLMSVAKLSPTVQISEAGSRSLSTAICMTMLDGLPITTGAMPEARSIDAAMEPAPVLARRSRAADGRDWSTPKWRLGAAERSPPLICCNRRHGQCLGRQPIRCPPHRGARPARNRHLSAQVSSPAPRCTATGC